MLKTITGREIDINPTDAAGAVAEYYRAFNGQDMELMELNWIDSEDASTNDPLGGLRRGWKCISREYERLFRLAAKPRIELHDLTIHATAESFLCVGRELLRFHLDDRVLLEVSIRSSRWFTRMYGRWRQFHYHGSIDDANHLRDFQSWVHAQPTPSIETSDRVELRSVAAPMVRNGASFS